MKKKTATNWNVYCSRFLIKAKQLTSPFTFVDLQGNKYHGAAGDYFVESVEGGFRILPRKLMEDVYMCMGRAKDSWQAAQEKAAVEIAYGDADSEAEKNRHKTPSKFAPEKMRPHSIQRPAGRRAPRLSGRKRVENPPAKRASGALIA